jgi:hypothetical protein
MWRTYIILSLRGTATTPTYVEAWCFDGEGCRERLRRLGCNLRACAFETALCITNGP